MRVLLTLFLVRLAPARFVHPDARRLLPRGCAGWAAVLGKLADTFTRSGTLTRSGHGSHLGDLGRDDDVCLANDR
jgi:hypothetical protein